MSKEETTMCECGDSMFSHMHIDEHTNEWTMTWCRNVMCKCERFSEKK